MDAEAIVNAMEEAGLFVTNRLTVVDMSQPECPPVGLWADVKGEFSAWTRFRGVPLDEVEKAVRGWVSTVNLVLRANKVEMQLDPDDTWEDIERRLRGGNT